MFCSLLSLAGLAAGALAFRHLSNTNLTLPCGIPFATTADNLAVFERIRNGTIHPGSDAASTIFGPNNAGGPKPWPRRSNQLVVIRYCYISRADRDKIGNAFEGAISNWMHFLGGHASKTSGHAVSFREARNRRDNEPLYCEKIGDPEDWNKAIPRDTIAILYNPRLRSASASVGLFQTPERSHWAMTFMIGEGYPVGTVEHEVGHILGMGHEHQRADRDRYVNYKCHQLSDFDEAYGAAFETIPGLTYKRFCEDLTLAVAFYFSGRDYVVHKMRSNGRQWMVNDAGTDYDVKSVMHYPSMSWAKRGCTRTSVENCPITKYKHPNDPQNGEVEAIFRNVIPSDGDIAWVKAMYPWKD